MGCCSSKTSEDVVVSPPPSLPNTMSFAELYSLYLEKAEKNKMEDNGLLPIYEDLGSTEYLDSHSDLALPRYQDNSLESYSPKTTYESGSPKALSRLRL